MSTITEETTYSTPTDVQPKHQSIPSMEFHNRTDDNFEMIHSHSAFLGKKVIVFGLPGAFTPTCSTQQVPAYEDMYDKFIDEGIDEVYVTSVNDGFVMKSWLESLGITKVKPLSDGSGAFARAMGMLVAKDNLGFGMRSWRYSMMIDDGIIQHFNAEPGLTDNCQDDPYGQSIPEVILEQIKQDKVMTPYDTLPRGIGTEDHMELIGQPTPQHEPTFEKGSLHGDSTIDHKTNIHDLIGDAQINDVTFGLVETYLLDNGLTDEWVQEYNEMVQQLPAFNLEETQSTEHDESDDLEDAKKVEEGIPSGTTSSGSLGI